MILLLGASGLLGHNVLRLLQERGESVRVLLRPGSSLLPGIGGHQTPFCPPTSRELASGGQIGPQRPPELQYGSLLDPDTLLQAAEGCDAIVNCAGTTDMSLRKLDDYLPVNRDLPRLLCWVLDETGIRTLVHTSTANTLAPGSREYPSDESAPFAAPFDRSFYAISKKEGEEVLLDDAAKHPERRIIIVNPGFMLGPFDPKPSSGTLLLAAYRRRLMAAPCGGKSFLHVRDAATAIVNAIRQGKSGRYLLTGEYLTFREFYALQAKVCGYRQRFFTLPTPMVRLAGRLGDLVQGLGIRSMLCTRNMDQLLVGEWYDCSRARRELGLPQTPVADAIRDFFAWRAGQSRKATP